MHIFDAVKTTRREHGIVRRDDRSDRPHLMWVYTGDLSKALDAATWLNTTRELRELGWCVTLIGVGPKGRQCNRGIEYFGVSTPNIYLVRQAMFHLRVLSILLRQWYAIDMVMFHQMSAAWLLPLRLVPKMRWGRRPLLVMDTRTLPMNSSENTNMKSRLRVAYCDGVRRAANRWADGRTAITSRMAEAERIPAARLWGIWSSGVDLDMFESALANRSWPAAEEPVGLVYIGSLHHERNLMALCEAVRLANATEMMFHLKLIGSGSQADELAQVAAQSDGMIDVLPPVPHQAIPGILEQEHVGVLPFPDEEKFRVSSPIKLFEYMAAGMPILATRIACNTDVIGKDRCAFWAERSDAEGLLEALRTLWKERSMLPEMALQAMTAAQHWTWRAAAENLDAAFSRGAAQHKRVE